MADLDKARGRKDAPTADVKFTPTELLARLVDQGVTLNSSRSPLSCELDGRARQPTGSPSR